MAKKILIGCYEIPGYGGAATASYKLFDLLRNDGLDVRYVNLVHEQDEDYFKYLFGENYGNPKGIPRVDTCILKGGLFGDQAELTGFIKKTDPDAMVGIDSIAALIMKKAHPEKKMIFYTSGSNQLRDFVLSKRLKRIPELCDPVKKTSPKLTNQSEYEAVKVSDLVIAHSDMTRDAFNYFFPLYGGKIYSRTLWFAEWIYKDALHYSGFSLPFDARDIDLLFISSIWNRPEKNLTFLKYILGRYKNRLAIHVVGESEHPIEHATHHGFIASREELFRLFGRTKAVVSLSLYDSAPGILFEASAMNCNIVASKNCGNWQLCNKELLVEDMSVGRFCEKIESALSKKYSDNIDYFLNAGSYKELLRVLRAF